MDDQNRRNAGRNPHGQADQGRQSQNFSRPNGKRIKNIRQNRSNKYPRKIKVKLKDTAADNLRKLDERRSPHSAPLPPYRMDPYGQVPQAPPGPQAPYAPQAPHAPYDQAPYVYPPYPAAYGGYHPPYAPPYGPAPVPSHGPWYGQAPYAPMAPGAGPRTANPRTADRRRGPSEATWEYPPRPQNWEEARSGLPHPEPYPLHPYETGQPSYPQEDRRAPYSPSGPFDPQVGRPLPEKDLGGLDSEESLGQPEREDRSGRPGRPARSSRQTYKDDEVRLSRPDRPDRSAPPVRPDRPDRLERPDRPGRPDRLERPARPGRPDRPDVPDRQSYAEDQDLFDSPMRPVRADQLDRPGRMEEKTRDQDLSRGQAKKMKDQVKGVRDQGQGKGPKDQEKDQRKAKRPQVADPGPARKKGSSSQEEMVASPHLQALDRGIEERALQSMVYNLSQSSLQDLENFNFYLDHRQGLVGPAFSAPFEARSHGAGRAETNLPEGSPLADHNFENRLMGDDLQEAHPFKMEAPGLQFSKALEPSSPEPPESNPRETLEPISSDAFKLVSPEAKPLEAESLETKPLKAELLETEALETELPVSVDPHAGKKRMRGFLDIMPDGYGFLRVENFNSGPNDIYVHANMIQEFHLRKGDLITGPVKPPYRKSKFEALICPETINGVEAKSFVENGGKAGSDVPVGVMVQPDGEELAPNPDDRAEFELLKAVYPDQRLVMETTADVISTRMIDLLSPIGWGQRGLIVSPPKAGKTTLLKQIGQAINHNSPETHLIVLLIDERPEEVSDMESSVTGDIAYSTFDKNPENHIKVAELVLEHAHRLVEMGEDVVILLDSITRLGRAYNLTVNSSGKTLSGGLDPAALKGPKRFFGSARKIQDGGSLTILATALVETGSRLDDLIFEEFKGTGNMEVYLDRKLAEQRIFPAINVNKSGTRKENLLLDQDALKAVWLMRRTFAKFEPAKTTATIIELMHSYATNEELVNKVLASVVNK